MPDADSSDVRVVNPLVDEMSDREDGAVSSESVDGFEEHEEGRAVPALATARSSARPTGGDVRSKGRSKGRPPKRRKQKPPAPAPATNEPMVPRAEPATVASKEVEFL